MTTATEDERGRLALPDLSDLKREARISPDGEAYREVASGSEFRLGVSAQGFSSGCVLISVEIALRVLRPEEDVCPERMDRISGLARELRRDGYALRHLDDGWIGGAREIDETRLSEECESLVHRLRSGVGGEGA